MRTVQRSVGLTFFNLCRYQDYFNIILFSTSTQTNSDELVQATGENKRLAKQFVDQHYHARGGTDIDKAYHNAFLLLHDYLERKCNFQKVKA